MASNSVSQSEIKRLIFEFNRHEDFLQYLRSVNILVCKNKGAFEYYQLEYVCIAEDYTHDPFNETVCQAMFNFMVNITS